MDILLIKELINISIYLFLYLESNFGNCCLLDRKLLLHPLIRSKGIPDSLIIFRYSMDVFSIISGQRIDLHSLNANGSTLSTQRGKLMYLRLSQLLNENFSINETLLDMILIVSMLIL